MSFFDELGRRNVFRVGSAYAVIAWIIAQVAGLALDGFEAPAWALKLILVLLALGFPLALFFAWAYELTPEGLKRERDVDRSYSISKRTGQRLNHLIIILLLTACGVLLVDRFVLSQGSVTGSAEVTIAVLPFENRSSLEEDDYFVQGIHDDLLTRLSRIRNWRVISRTSVEGIATENRSIPKIAKELGATHIVEGSVQRSSDSIRVIIQLIDAGSDSHVWAPDPYDRELTAENVFRIQSEIATSIAGSLKTVLSVDDRDRVSAIGTYSLEAYDKYLQGLERLWERNESSVNEAVNLFRETVEMDENFAAAWEGLGNAYRLQATTEVLLFGTGCVLLH